MKEEALTPVLHVENANAAVAWYQRQGLSWIPNGHPDGNHGHLLIYGDPANPEAISNLLAVIGLQGPKGARDTHTTKSMADVIASADNLGPPFGGGA